MIQTKEREVPSPLSHRGIRKTYGQGQQRGDAPQQSSPGRRMTDAAAWRSRTPQAKSALEIEELVAGLKAPEARIASKYFYDPLGSRLFDAITHLPEYYPTRTEAAIFARHGAEMAQAIGVGTTLIDLGAGNCEKARALFGTLKPAQYVAVDISVEYLRDALTCLQHQFPAIEMRALGLDMAAGLTLPASVPADKRLFFYPGSSIGNFTPDESVRFLADVHSQCGQDGGLLIGVDLVKDKAVIDAAYDDALGVTASFNLNALNNVNAAIGADFDLRDWRHCGFFNAEHSRAEMHVETRLAVEVKWAGGSRHFEAGERIHTENSYKYRLDDFGALLRRAGFRNVTAWKDRRDWFAVLHASA